MFMSVLPTSTRNVHALVAMVAFGARLLQNAHIMIVPQSPCVTETTDPAGNCGWTPVRRVTYNMTGI